jgi:hypothetical protein
MALRVFILRNRTQVMDRGFRLTALTSTPISECDDIEEINYGESARREHF